MKKQTHSNEENKKLIVRTENGESEKNRSLLQSCDTEAETTVKKLLLPSQYFSLVNLHQNTLRVDKWLHNLPIWVINSCPQSYQLPIKKIIIIKQN